MSVCELHNSFVGRGQQCHGSIAIEMMRTKLNKLFVGLLVLSVVGTLSANVGKSCNDGS